MDTWKRREKQIAEAFGVTRNISRGSDFSLSVPDTSPHKIFSIEIKARKDLPKSLEIKQVAFLAKPPRIVKDALAQANMYYSEKIPLAVIVENKKSYKNAICCLWAHHYGTINNELPIYVEDSVVLIRLSKFLEYFSFMWDENA